QQGAWAYYNNNTTYACPYGKLYNWYACVDARGLCPTGWHVPSDGEWTVLTTFLGGGIIAGVAMKSTGTIQAGTGLWNSPNTGATNSSGFSGLPGGYRGIVGNYDGMGFNGYWWSSTQDDSNGPWVRYLYNNAASVGRGNAYTRSGWGVRCLRD
ncbi:MAG: fibrobacter succinogenes major paralogous domain-containing protein, partial [Flavobacteriales bacterium]